MDEETRTIAPARVGDGSREFLFAWVFFGAALFAAVAAASGATLAGPFSSLCLAVGLMLLAGGFLKRLVWRIEQRLIDIEAALKRGPADQAPPPQP